MRRFRSQAEGAAARGKPSKATTGNTTDIFSLRFALGYGLHIPLSVLLACIGSIAAGIFAFDQHYRVDPAKDELAEAKQRLSQETDTADRIRKESQAADIANRAALQDMDAPVLMTPTNGEEVTTTEIPFHWHFTKAVSPQSYVIEIVPMDSAGAESIVRAVVNPENERFYLPTKDLGSTRRAMWRVVPGTADADGIRALGRSSLYGAFSWDPSTIARVRRTGDLIIGTNPQLSGPFERQDEGTGKPIGLDIDLAKWLSQRIQENLKLNAPIRIRWRILEWEELLPSLQHNDVDLTISSMTRTLQRERDFRGVHFSAGYYQTHQILIARPEREFHSLKSLNGRIVGTIADTTNQQAAHLLRERIKFNIRDDFKTFDDLYAALDNETIDAALVDDVFVFDKIAAKRYAKVGDILDGELHKTSFYKDVIGGDTESYALAVSDAGNTAQVGEKSLLELINASLSSDAGKAFVKQLVQSAPNR